jgi:exosortase/archaeosortase family protein
LTRRAARPLTSLVLVAVAVLLVAGEHIGRQVESSIARWVLHALTGATVLPSGASTVPAVAFTSGALQWNVLEITVECAVAYTLAALVLLGAALALVPRFGAARVVLATTVGAALLVLVNQVRIVMLALVLAHGGVGPFEWAHSFAGSVVSLSGLAGTLFVVFAIVIRPGTGPRTWLRVNATSGVQA